MIINLPKLGPVKFRDDLTPDQFQSQLTALSQKYGFELPRPEYGLGESFTKGVSRGLSRMGSVITDTIPALAGSALGQDEYAREQLEEAKAKEAELQRTNPAQFTSYKQIEGLGDFARFSAETLGETVPDILGIIGTGGIGGALGKRAAVKGAEEVAANLAKKEAIRDVLPGGVGAERLGQLNAAAIKEAAPEIAKQKAFGQAAGVYLGSYAVNTPDVFQSIYENTGELAPGASLLFGGAVAALDAVLPAQLLKSMTQTQKLSIAEKVLEKSGMQSGLLRKAAAIVPVTAAKEGLTEGAQEFITAAAEKFVDENQDLFSSENFNRYIESAVRGAVAGGPFGGLQAVGERLGERGEQKRKEYEEYQRQAEAAQPREPQQLDLFAPGEITPPSPGEITPPSPGLTFPSSIPPTPPEEPVTARTEYEGEKKYRKAQLGLRQQPYEVQSNAIPGQMEMFDEKGKPTLEADVKRIEAQVEAARKQKVAEGKADAQALKEAIAELAPKDIDLLNYAGGIGRTGLFQLVQQATQIPQRKGAVPQGKAQPTTEETAPEEQAPPTVLTPERLKDMGLSPRAGIYKRLVGKDLLNDEAAIRAEIETATGNPNLSKATITALEALEGQMPLVLTQPTPESLAERTTPTAPEFQTQEPQQAAVSEVPKEQTASDFTAPKGAVVEEPTAPVQYSPEEVWDDMDTGVLFADLTKENKQLWEEAVRSRLATSQRADDIAARNGISKKEAKRKKPVPEEELTEEPADIGEREAAEIDDITDLEKAKARVGEAVSKLVSSIGGKNNLTPEEQGSLSELMSALGELMYQLVRSGVRTFTEALPKAKKAANQKAPEISKYVTNEDYEKLFEEAQKAHLKILKETPKADQTLFTKIVNQPFNALPPATQEITNGAFNALSNVPATLRQAALGFLSLDQIAEVYGTIMPSIKKLIDVLERRATTVSRQREFLEKNANKYHEVFKKYTAEQKEKFFQTFFDTTVDQIDPLTVTVKETINSNGQTKRDRTYSLTKNPATASNPITQAFYAMPKDVQEVYVDMRREYDKYADALEDLITKDVSPGTAKKLRTQFELRRLKVYLPLFRQGNYWLSYTDSSGEPVVMAFTTERERQLEKQRASNEKAKDIKEFARFDDVISRDGRPPVGFVGKILETLKDERVPERVLDQVYSSYLSLFPAESVRQMYRKRKGVAGYETDAVEVYANVGSRMVNQIGNLAHAKEIDSAINGIVAEGEQDGSMAARDVVNNITAQTKYMMNPVPNKWSARASSFSYYMYIAGNVSSALINLTQLPIVVYGLLAGEYSASDAYAAMKSATTMYLNGGKDSNSEFLPDWTFGASKNLRPDLKRLYDKAVQQAVIRRSTSHEIVDMRKTTAGDYTGLRAKAETGLAWMFQNSERANREITLIAAYELARKKGLSEEAAITKAMDTVKAAHGSSLSETGPRFFQGDILRVVFTFKRFAQSQIYLLQKLFRQAFLNADPEVRSVARKQLVGIYGMAFMFAGAQGLPLYGATAMLAGFLMGDDDDPVDIDGYVNEAVGDLIYKGPVNQLLNIDIAGRTGFNNLVWRDNPKRLAEVGPVTYAIEQLAGPSYSAALNVQRGLGMISDGEVWRGFEALTPGAVRNVAKGFRFAIDGATNRDGVPIVEDVNAYNVVMQIAGFTPADLAEAYARAGAKKQIEKKILERRTSLLDKLYAARQDGDLDGVQEIREAIRDFNEKNPEKNVRIEQSTMDRSYRGHKQREREMEDGVRINPALKRRLNEEYGNAED